MPPGAVVGEEFEIRATVFREGHDAVNASVIVTNPSGQETEVRMEPTTPLGFDWWHTYVSLGTEGAWTFRVEAGATRGRPGCTTPRSRSRPASTST